MDLEMGGNLTVKELFELLKMLAVEEERLHGSRTGAPRANRICESYRSR